MLEANDILYLKQCLGEVSKSSKIKLVQPQTDHQIVELKYILKQLMQDRKYYVDQALVDELKQLQNS